MKLINRSTDIIISPNDNIVSPVGFCRRDFLLFTALSPTLALLPANQAKAFLPFVIGIIARSIIPGIARGVARHLTKKMATNKIKSLARTGALVGYTSLPSNVKASVVEEIASRLTEDGIKNASKYAIDKIAQTDAKAVWAQTDYDNSVDVTISNESEKRIETSLSFILQDIKTGAVEIKDDWYTVESEPLRMANFNIDSFRNLPLLGEKKVIGLSAESSGIKIRPSEKILILDTKKLFI